MPLLHELSEGVREKLLPLLVESKDDLERILSGQLREEDHRLVAAVVSLALIEIQMREDKKLNPTSVLMA